MSTQRTLSIIKPDAVKANHIGAIFNCFETAGLRIVATKMLQLSLAQAEQFYAIHKERPFFNDLVRFMCSGPVVVSILEGQDAVAKHRELMGATDPKKATPESIRGKFAKSIDENAVHGSDALETAREEIEYFFPKIAICNR